MQREPELFDASVVVLGTFAPAMFSPDWFLENELIGTEDFGAIKESPSLVVSHTLTVLESESFRLEIMASRLAVISKGVVTPAIRDLVAGVLLLIPKSPVSAIGLNCGGHYKMESTRDYHKVGDIFAPKDIWNKVFPARPSNAGLLGLTIGIFPFDRDVKPKSNDVKRVTIQPSVKVIPNAVYLSMNNHRATVGDDKKEIATAEEAAQLIQGEWEPTLAESQKVFDALISEALKTE